nr:MAG TPA: hypothetical protein [Bacteriophage sp.]DAZ49855.1 MAG TPA: hypothetical protein [Caudoviricetes sp.]
MAAREQKRIIGREFNNRVINQRGQKEIGSNIKTNKLITS